MVRNMMRLWHDQAVSAQGPASSVRGWRHLGIQASRTKRLRMQLAALDTAKVIADMDVPGFRLHRLKGALQTQPSISGNGN